MSVVAKRCTTAGPTGSACAAAFETTFQPVGAVTVSV